MIKNLKYYEHKTVTLITMQLYTSTFKKLKEIQVQWKEKNPKKSTFLVHSVLWEHPVFYFQT